MLNSLQNGRYSFIFTTLLVNTTNATISTKNSFFYLSQFSPPYYTLIYSQNHPYNPTNTTFLYISAIFHLPIFAYNHPNNLNQKSLCEKCPNTYLFLVRIQENTDHK